MHWKFKKVNAYELRGKRNAKGEEHRCKGIIPTQEENTDAYENGLWDNLKMSTVALKES